MNKAIKKNNNEALYLKYNIDVNDYEGYSIDFTKLSIRTRNCLIRNNINSITDLLKMSCSSLFEINNFGVTSFEDVEKYIHYIKNTMSSDKSTNNRKKNKHNIKPEHKELIAKSLEIDELLIDNSLLDLCKSNIEYTDIIIKVLDDFYDMCCIKNNIKKCINSVENKKNNRVDNYVTAYDSGQTCESLKMLLGKEITVGELAEFSIDNNLDLNEVNSLAKWIRYNLNDEFQTLLSDIYGKSDKYQTVVELRSQNNTLQEVGEQIGLTRERVRQIEAKVVKKFSIWYRNTNLISRLSADLDGKKVVEYNDLKKIFYDNANILFHLLKCCDDEFFSVDKKTKTLILVSDDLTYSICVLINKIPEMFDEDNFDEYVSQIYNKTFAPERLIVREIKKRYHKTGRKYHINKLSYSKMYLEVLKKYYPDGMYVYDDNQIQDFKRLVRKEFGDVDLPDNNRAIISRITSESILCDKGKYKPKKEKYISQNLLDKIIEYVERDENGVIFINAIYFEFENELNECGIDNKYYLHGILRELLRDKFFFSRDYISRDRENLSLYGSVVNFIKKSKYPVNKQQIRDAFPGITEIMIMVAVSEEAILNYFGSYVYYYNLKIYDEDIKYLQEEINWFLRNKGPIVHASTIYEYIVDDNVQLLRRLGIYYQSSLFSLLEYLFSEDYKFSKPYISLNGVSVNRPKEILDEFVNNNDFFEVEELFEMANEYSYGIYDKLKFLLSFNDTHFLINKKEMMSVNEIGIKEEYVEEIETLIINEISETTYISDLKCIYKLKKINIEWNEWLLYSIINKWGSKLEVGTTSKYFKYSRPVIALKNNLCVEELCKNENSDAMISRPDDLDDIDAVFESILEDIEW